MTEVIGDPPRTRHPISDVRYRWAQAVFTGALLIEVRRRNERAHLCRPAL